MQPTALSPQHASLLATIEHDGPALTRYLARLLGSGDEAEDVFQDAVLRALRVPVLPPAAELRPWLYRIASNRAIDIIRRRRSTPLDFDPPGRLDLAGEAERAEVARVLRRAADALPARQRAAVILRYLEDRSYGDVAAALGCTEATARANVYQGIRRLRRELAPFGEELL